MTSLPTPSELYRRYGSRTKKRFGQHFLTDPRILDRIADEGGATEGVHVVEVGPGCGTLTTTMLARGAQVTAIEIDDDAADFLESELGEHAGFTLIRGDATATDFKDVTEAGAVAIANLPYNVGTQILFAMLESGAFTRLTLMFQKEVAQRVAAKSGDSSFGALSLQVRLFADTRLAFELGGGAFTPPPKVRSSVVVLDVVENTRIENPETRATFRLLVREGFAQRRKTLANCLKRAGRSGDDVLEWIAAIERDPRVRAEQLNFDEFATIAALASPRNLDA